MGVKTTDGFDPGDDEKVVSVLNKWKGGVLSDQLFAAVSKLTPQISTIIVLFRKNGDILETLLIKRPEDDPIWPGMLNLPGKMFRAADFNRNDKNPINGPFERIQNEELGIKLDNIKFSGVAYQNTKRGNIVVLVHVAEVPVDFVGKPEWIWRDVAKMSQFSDMIPTEMAAIEVAIKSFK